jgi:RNA polymerase sigma factor (sigma-70 family)
VSSTGEPISEVTLARLLSSHREFLAFLERRVGSRDVAEELLQEAFLRSIDKGGAIRDGESSVAWFYRVLRNALVDRARREAAASRALQKWAWEPAESMDAALHGDICTCFTPLLDTLKAEYAEILRAVDLGQTSVAEFAQRAGITPNNAAVRLHRARAALERQLRLTCGTCAEHGCLDCHCAGPCGGASRSV